MMALIDGRGSSICLRCRLRSMCLDRWQGDRGVLEVFWLWLARLLRKKPLVLGVAMVASK